MSLARTRAPKRPILRVRNIIDDIITNTQSDLILHTSTDPETLVRMIIALNLVLIDVTQVTREYHLLFQVGPSGTLILQPISTQLLDSDAPQQLLTEFAGVQNTETAAGAQMIEKLEADLRSMRKMKPGDTIQLSHISQIASAFQMRGVVTLFFKQ